MFTVLICVGKDQKSCNLLYCGILKTVFSFPCPHASSRLLPLSNSSLTCYSEDMGFFSSRQAEDNDVYQVTLGVGGRHGGNDKSVVQVIRSRFVRSLLLVQCRVVTHAR